MLPRPPLKAVIALLAFPPLMDAMHTLTPTQAQAKLPALLRQALDGQEIGIVCGDRIVALRPVEVTATDYARMEYGITGDEMATIAANLHAKAKKAITTGKARTFTGDLESTLRG